MIFQEKSAWVMLMASLVTAFIYFSGVFSHSNELGHIVLPSLANVMLYTLILIVIAVAGHIITAALSPKNAGDSPDEREQQFLNRAGNLSGYILSFCIVMSLGLYFVHASEALLFYSVFASLIAGQVAVYIFQIFFYRGVLQ